MADAVSWREVSILEELGYAVKPGVLATPATGRWYLPRSRW